MAKKIEFKEVGKVLAELLYSEQAPTVMKTTVDARLQTNRMQNKNLKRAIFLFKKIASSSFYNQVVNSGIITIRINLNGLSVVYFRNTLKGVEVSFKVAEVKCEENTLISFLCVLKLLNMLIVKTHSGKFSDSFSILSDVATGTQIMSSLLSQVEEHKKSGYITLDIKEGAALKDINPAIRKN